MELLHIAIFLLYKIFQFFYDNIILLGCLSPLYKYILTKVNTNALTSAEICLPFFSFYTYVYFENVQCFVKKAYAFEHNHCLQIKRIEKG